jgi:hypothetical protein
MNYDQPQDAIPENKIEGVSKRVKKLVNEIKEKQEELEMLRGAEEIEGIKVSLKIKHTSIDGGMWGPNGLHSEDFELCKPDGTSFGLFRIKVDTKKGITRRELTGGDRNDIEGISDFDKSELEHLLWKTFHQNDLYNGTALILENDEELLNLIRKIFGNES